MQVSHGNLVASTVVVTSDPAGTTYIQGTDYTVNAVTGLISQIGAGAIGAAQEVFVSYSYYSGAAYAAGHDYNADLINGVLTLAAGSAIAPGATVAVSFNYGDPSQSTGQRHNRCGD